MRQTEKRLLEWATATRCRLGEATSGDLAAVITRPGAALFAVIDGSGHGPEAARAARVAAKAVRESADEDLTSLIRSCHKALRCTRGAALSLAFVTVPDSTVTWLGIGNVEGRLVHGPPAAPREKGSLPLAPGVAGHALPPLKTTTLRVTRGDVLLFTTDGIEASFEDSLNVSGGPREIAERIMADHWRASDDALVLAVRYLGMKP